MEGRRLDYDYKKKRQGKIPDEEIQVAQEKFNESKELSGKAMVSLLELDVSNVCTNILHLQFTDYSFLYAVWDFLILKPEILSKFSLAFISTNALLINLNPHTCKLNRNVLRFCFVLFFVIYNCPSEDVSDDLWNPIPLKKLLS